MFGTAKKDEKSQQMKMIKTPRLLSREAERMFELSPVKSRGGRILELCKTGASYVKILYKFDLSYKRKRDDDISLVSPHIL